MGDALAAVAEAVTMDRLMFSVKDPFAREDWISTEHATTKSMELRSIAED